MRVAKVDTMFTVFLLLVVSGSFWLVYSEYKHQETAPLSTYPYVDQVGLSTTLKPDESFVSIQHQAGRFTLVTAVSAPGPKTFRVYTGLVGDRGTLIEQPRVWYTIKEQQCKTKQQN